MIRLRTTMLVGLWLTGVVYAQGERERVTACGGQTPFSRAGESAADKAVDIGSRLELFVDGGQSAPRLSPGGLSAPGWRPPCRHGRLAHA